MSIPKRVPVHFPYLFRNWPLAIRRGKLCCLYRRTCNGQIDRCAADKTWCTLYYSNFPSIEHELCEWTHKNYYLLFSSNEEKERNDGEQRKVFLRDVWPIHNPF